MTDDVRPVGPDRPGTAALDLFRRLNLILERHKTEVEFYFLGGAVLFQAFQADPDTARIEAMFQPAAIVRAAIREVANSAAAPDDWLARGVRSVLAAGASRRYVEFSHVSVFVPLPEYVLAVKCAALRLGEGFQEMDDLRYVLRAMNITSADEALRNVTQYFAERQLALNTSEALEGLLGA